MSSPRGIRPIKRAKPKRDWVAAREKVEAEGRCRVCGRTFLLEAAHVIPRSRVGIRGGKGEAPANIVPLCGADPYDGGSCCHGSYDSGTLDLRPFLTADEWAYAVELVGLAEAERRVGGSRKWRAA